MKISLNAIVFFFPINTCIHHPSHTSIRGRLSYDNPSGITVSHATNSYLHASVQRPRDPNITTNKHIFNGPPRVFLQIDLDSTHSCLDLAPST